MNFKRINKEIIIPTKANSTDAGYDIYAPFNFEVQPHSFSERINLGVAFEVPFGYCGYVVERSSQGKKGINVIGPVVDHGYTGNIHCTLVNNDDVIYLVNKDDRICQLLLLQIGNEELIEVEEFKLTDRGENSHGSSGK